VKNTTTMGCNARKTNKTNKRITFPENYIEEGKDECKKKILLLFL
jgi:hypothetical protein